MIKLEFDFKLEKNEFRAEMRGVINDPITGISGPSGAGKTTFFNILSGLETPLSGRIALNDCILFDSINKTSAPISQRRIGVVFQENCLFPHMNVKKNLLYGYNLLKKGCRKLNLEDVCELLEIEELLKRYPHEISGGQAQRVAIGRALLTSPRLLLMDEPFSALNNKLRLNIIKQLQLINTEFSMPIVLISHNKDDFYHLGATIHKICEGRYLMKNKVKNNSIYT